MFSLIKSLFKSKKADKKEGNKDDYLFVYTHNESVYADGIDGKRKDGTVFFHFYETPDGKKKIEYSVTLPVSDKMLRDFVIRSEYYNTVCRKWLSGRIVAEIPSYEDAKSEDLIEKLKK